MEEATKLERPVVFTEGIVNRVEGPVRLQAGRQQDVMKLLGEETTVDGRANC